MTFSLAKFFDPLTQPMAILWVILLIAVLRDLSKLRVGTAVFHLLLAAGLTLIGSTGLPAMWVASLERPYLPPDLRQLPECDAIIMLGGSHHVSAHDAYGVDLGEPADRILMAAELARLKKGSVLVLGGGSGDVGGRSIPEAELIGRWLKDWQAVPIPVESLGPCANTRDEALRTKALAQERKWKRLILVSSGYHLRRAEAVFRDAELDVVPVGCDFLGTAYLARRHPFTVFPRHTGFTHLRLYLHEQVGWIYYRIQGWIG